MRTARRLAVALLIASTTLTFSLPATSAPLMTNAATARSAAETSDVTTVQHRHHGYRGPGYRHPHHHHHRRGGGNTAAGIGIGLAAGAIIGGAIAASQAQAQQNAAYCAQRFRSYDPRSGTYLSTDGNRYPCP